MRFSPHRCEGWVSTLRPLRATLQSAHLHTSARDRRCTCTPSEFAA
jgi:hypothetical protein